MALFRWVKRFRASIDSTANGFHRQPPHLCATAVCRRCQPVLPVNWTFVRFVRMVCPCQWHQTHIPARNTSDNGTGVNRCQLDHNTFLCLTLANRPLSTVCRCRPHNSLPTWLLSFVLSGKSHHSVDWLSTEPVSWSMQHYCHRQPFSLSHRCYREQRNAGQADLLLPACWPHRCPAPTLVHRPSNNNSGGKNSNDRGHNANTVDCRQFRCRLHRSGVGSLLFPCHWRHCRHCRRHHCTYILNPNCRSLVHDLLGFLLALVQPRRVHFDRRLSDDCWLWLVMQQL